MNNPRRVPLRRRDIMAVPSADVFARNGRNARIRTGIFGAVLALICACLYTVFRLDNIVFPAIFIVSVMIPILLWRFPKFSLFFLFLSVCLFECVPLGVAIIPTTMIPFFWNVNTIMQIYAGASGAHELPLNLFEIFILVAGAASLVRSVYTGTARVFAGPLLLPLLGYEFFVIFGWFHGLFTGGDFKISLQEVRSQFYLVLAYIIGINAVTDKDTIRKLQWAMVICIGMKGLFYTLCRFINYAGQPVPDQGVGSHEEAFFFNSFIIFFIVSCVYRPSKAMFYTMIAFLPLVIIGNLACNRRAGTAALIIALPIMVAVVYKTLPKYRKTIAIASVCFGLLGTAYYQEFKNSSSMLAQPARAVKSQFDPDERDASSNSYRDAENADLMATIRLDPILGYGYGKRMLHAVPIADISKTYEFWDIVTHDQILWIWMRVGTIGFIAFWLAMCGCIIYGVQRATNPDVDWETQGVALYTVLVLTMLIVFGLLDLQLSNFRDMLFTGMWIGIMAGSARVASIPVANLGTDEDVAPSPLLASERTQRFLTGGRTGYGRTR